MRSPRHSLSCSHAALLSIEASSTLQAASNSCTLLSPAAPPSSQQSSSSLPHAFCNQLTLLAHSHHAALSLSVTLALPRSHCSRLLSPRLALADMCECLQVQLRETATVHRDQSPKADSATLRRPHCCARAHCDGSSRDLRNERIRIFSRPRGIFECEREA